MANIRMYKCTNVRAGDSFWRRSATDISKNLQNTARTEDRSHLSTTVPERFPSRTSPHWRRYIQSECFCNDGALGFTGGWSQLSKPICEKDGGYWRIEAS